MWQLFIVMRLTEAHVIQSNGNVQQKCQQLHQMLLPEQLADLLPLAACTTINNG